MPRKPAGDPGWALVISRRSAVVDRAGKLIVVGEVPVTRTPDTGRQRLPSQAETAMVAGRACWASPRNHACKPVARRAGDQDSDTQSAGRAALIWGSSAV